MKQSVTIHDLAFRRIAASLPLRRVGRGLAEVVLGETTWNQAIKIDRRSKLAILPIAIRPGESRRYDANDVNTSVAI